MSGSAVHLKVTSSAVRCGAPMRDDAHPDGWDLGTTRTTSLEVTCLPCFRRHTGCSCGFPTNDGVRVAWSAAWHRAHKIHHLAAFPAIAELDPGTVRNLDEFIDAAERAEMTS